MSMAPAQTGEPSARAMRATGGDESNLGGRLRSRPPGLTDAGSGCSRCYMLYRWNRERADIEVGFLAHRRTGYKGAGAAAYRAWAISGHLKVSEG